MRPIADLRDDLSDLLRCSSDGAHRTVKVGSQLGHASTNDIETRMLVIAYALLAPPLGALAFWSLTMLPTAMLATFQHGFDPAAWSPAVKLLTIYASYCYLLGFLPALGTGIGHALVRRRLGSSKSRVIVVTATGLVLLALFKLVGAKSSSFDETTIAFVAAGGISALLIASAVELVSALRLPRPAAG